MNAIDLARDIGHDFPLSESDFEALKAYESGHRTLIACLQAGRVSPATRERIESTVFLPAGWKKSK